MNFSVFQWLVLIVLDLLLKAACVYLLLGAITLDMPSIPMLTAISLMASFFHLALLGVANVVTSFSERTRLRRFVLTLVIGEGLFAAITCFWGALVVGSRLTECPAVISCSWTDVTLGGIQFIAWLIAFGLLINLLPIMATMALGCLASFIRRSLQRIRAQIAFRG